MDGEQCSGCRFYRHKTDGPKGENVGECRRSPPQIRQDGAAGPDRFPEVWEWKWCGEYQPKPVPKF